MAEFAGINMAALEEEQQGLSDNNDSNDNDILKKFVKMPQGDGYIILRLLPPVKGKNFYQETRIHKLDNDSTVRNVHCPRVKSMLNGKRAWLDKDRKHPCPICKYYSELWKEADEAEKNGDKDHAEKLKAQARAIKPIERYYYNAIVLECYPEIEDQELKVPKILSIGKTLHSTIITSIVGDPKQKLESLGDVTRIKDGRNFKIVKKMKKSGNQTWPDYGKSDFEDPTPLGTKEEVDLYLENLHNLEELRRLVEHDEIKVALKKYLGLLEDENDTDFDMNEYRGGGGGQSLEDQVNCIVGGGAKEEKKSAAHQALLEEDENPVHQDSGNSVTSQAAKELGGSGNDDSLLSDDEFFNDLKNV